MSGSGVFKALIVGWSVGGLAAAHELRAIDADVAVYERSTGRTQARGAGIVMQPEVEALLTRLGVSAPSVSVELHERQQLHVHGGTTSYRTPQLMTAWRRSSPRACPARITAPSEPAARSPPNRCHCE